MENPKLYVLNYIEKFDSLYQDIGLMPGHVFTASTTVTISLEELKKLLPEVVTDVCSDCIFGGESHPNPIIKKLGL